MLPILITLVLGIMEFGHLYNAQIVISNSAREAARTMAVTNNPDSATRAARNVAAEYTLNIAPLTCATSSTDPNIKQVTATVTSNVGLITGSWLGLPANIPVSGIGVMRCGG